MPDRFLAGVKFRIAPKQGDAVMPATYVSDHPHAIFVGEAASVVPPARPRRTEDYPTILVVHAEAAALSRGDLETLDAFGRAVTRHYDETVGAPRALANFAEVGPIGDRWFARKFTWTQSLRTFATVGEAVDFLSGCYGVEPDPEAPGPR